MDILKPTIMNSVVKNIMENDRLDDNNMFAHKCVKIIEALLDAILLKG